LEDAGELPLPQVDEGPEWLEDEEQADEESEDESMDSEEILLEDSPKADLYDEGIAGLARICVFRNKSKHPELQATQDTTAIGRIPPWVDHFSKHGHAAPTSRFLHQVSLMDSVFLTIHKDSVDVDKGVIRRFTEQVAGLPGFKLPLVVIRAFGKLRLDVRLRVLNSRKNRSKYAVLQVNAKEKFDKDSRACKKSRQWMC